MIYSWIFVGCQSSLPNSKVDENFECDWNATETFPIDTSVHLKALTLSCWWSFTWQVNWFPHSFDLDTFYALFLYFGYWLCFSFILNQEFYHEAPGNLAKTEQEEIKSSWCMGLIVFLIHFVSSNFKETIRMEIKHLDEQSLFFMPVCCSEWFTVLK